jgi:hypothetical protein
LRFLQQNHVDLGQVAFDDNVFQLGVDATNIPRTQSPLGSYREGRGRKNKE